MRRALSRRSVLLGAALALLAGCETQVPRSQFPELAYSQLPPINLNVARVEVVQQYHPPGKKPNVEHLFPVVPALAAERWAHDRLKAVGADGMARVTIVYAGVVEVPLKRMGGIEGAFTKEQSERYDGAIEVKIDILTGDGRQAASVSTRAERRRTVPEDITLLGREKVWFEMTEAMMNDLNASLERQIKDNFGNWLVSGASPAAPGAAPAPSGGTIRVTPLQ